MHNERMLARKTSRSQAYFNPWLLFFYDFIVFRCVANFVWGISVDQLLHRYRVLTHASHLEVGVGTGYLLDKLDPDYTDIDLMDLSDSCLRKTSARLVRFNPISFRHDILKPLDETMETMTGRYQSICLNFVLHCVPGGFASKSIAFANLKPLLQSDGVIFGATVLSRKARPKLIARTALRLLNAIGIFNNEQDHAEELLQGLKRHFVFVEVTIVGATALFFASDDNAKFARKRAEVNGRSAS